MVEINASNKHLWEILSEIPDPEIPAINLVELGVIRAIEDDDNTINVIITPTYTGCPAKKLFEDLIREKLIEKGYKKINISMKLAPAWNTDWISEEAKDKLMKAGISPPNDDDKVITCPQCKSTNTKMISQFAAVACQSLYSCNECKEPFNYFKCHR